MRVRFRTALKTHEVKRRCHLPSHGGALPFAPYPNGLGGEGEMRAGIFCRVAMCILIGYTSVIAADPSTTFARKCSSCHTFGRGVLVGPDLKGATDRHNRQWLTAWITSSETLIKTGDPAATALFARFKSQRMPDQGLTPSELSALIDYLAAAGP